MTDFGPGTVTAIKTVAVPIIKPGVTGLRAVYLNRKNRDLLAGLLKDSIAARTRPLEIAPADQAKIAKEAVGYLILPSDRAGKGIWAKQLGKVRRRWSGFQFRQTSAALSSMVAKAVERSLFEHLTSTSGDFEKSEVSMLAQQVGEDFPGQLKATLSSPTRAEYAALANDLLREISIAESLSSAPPTPLGTAAARAAPGVAVVVASGVADTLSEDYAWNVFTMILLGAVAAYALGALILTPSRDEALRQRVVLAQTFAWADEVEECLHRTGQPPSQQSGTNTTSTAADAARIAPAGEASGVPLAVIGRHLPRRLHRVGFSAVANAVEGVTELLNDGQASSDCGETIRQQVSLTRAVAVESLRRASGGG